MAYEKYTWVTGETITAELLNNMEQGIEDASEPQAVTWESVAEKPSTFPPTIGTTAETASAGNHTHNNYATVTALNALTARVEALENSQD